MRSVRDFLKKGEFALNVLTALIALYLAAANVLRGAKVPSEHFWAPWRGWFIAILVAALYVPLFALYKALDAHFEKEDRLSAEEARRSAAIDRDLLVYCQQAVAEIADLCRGVPLSHLASQIWLCTLWDDSRTLS